MKTQVSKLNENLKEMKQLAKAYAEAEKRNYAARNVKELDIAEAEMKDAFNKMMSVMKSMMTDMNVMGFSCGEMRAKEFYAIKKEQF